MLATALGLVALAASFAGAEAATTTAAPALEEPPLSAEELQLIERLGAATASVGEVAPILPPPPLLPWDPGEDVVERGLLELVPRSLGEAVVASPSFFEARRSYVPGDHFSARGRGRGRIHVSLDGVSLEHPFISIADDVTTSTLDPRMVSSVLAHGGPSLTASAWASAGQLELASRFPAGGRHLKTRVEVESRSADRSTGALIAVEGGMGPVGLLAEGSYADFGQLQLGGNVADVLAAHQRTNLALRGQLLGRDGDPARIRLGFDFDRLLNVLLPELELVDRFRSRRTVFGTLDLGSARQGLRLLVAQQTFQLERSLFASTELTSRMATSTFEVRIDGHQRLGSSLDLSAGGAIALGSGRLLAQHETELPSTDHQHRFGGYLAAEWSPEPLTVLGVLRLEHARDELLASDFSLTDTSLLGEVRAAMALGSAFRIEGGWAQTSRLPTLGDLARLSVPEGTPLTERSDAFDLGPVLQLSSFELGVAGFVTRARHCLEPTGLVLAPRDLWIWGLESRLGWRPIEGFHVGSAFTLADGRIDGSGDRPSELSAFRWQTDLRYELGTHGAYLEASFRMNLARPTPSTADLLRFGPTERLEWVVLSARGGLELGLGFSAFLALENFLDNRNRTFGSTVDGPGIDLRLALEHRVDLTFE